MFGAFRLVLALNVMAYHILNIPAIGPFAVYTFFILSGFLMTTIMNNSYGYNLSGIQSYALNRFLRLYPVYWSLILITVFIIIFITGTEFSASFQEKMCLPESAFEILTNLTMIYPAFKPVAVGPRLAPATWALTLELFYYLLIGIGISRNKIITIIWFSASLIYILFRNLYTGVPGLSYGDFFGASLPFSIGAMLFFYKIKLLRLLNKLSTNPTFLISCIYAVNLAFTSTSAFWFSSCWWKIEFISTILNVILSGALILALYQNGKELFSKKIDKFLGDLSYPVYIFHWSAASLASWWLYKGAVKGFTASGLLVFITALFITVVVSMVVNVVVNNRIEKIRSKIRKKQTSLFCSSNKVTEIKK